MALSLPSILATMLEPISSVIDTAIVGRFDTKLLAALAIGTTLISSLTWMFNFLVHAPIQGISDKIGKEKYDEVISLCKISLIIALFIGLSLIVVIYPFRFEIYNFMGASKELQFYCDEYFLIRLFGQSFILLFTVTLSLLRGLAKVNAALIFIAVSTTINVVFSYASIHYFDFGLKGVALATVLGNSVGFILSFFYLINQSEIKEKFWKQKIIRSDVFQFGENSLNIFGRSSILTLSFFLSTKIASNIGMMELAAHQIVLQIWLFASFFTDGVATTGNIIGARVYNTDQQVHLNEIFRKLLTIGLGIGLIFGGVFYLFEGVIVSSFTHDPTVKSAISGVWLLIAIAQIPLSMAYVYDGIIFGIGKFSFLRKHMIIAFFVCFSPFAIYGYEQKQLIGIWLAMAAVGLYRLVSNYFCVRREMGALIENK